MYYTSQGAMTGEDLREVRRDMDLDQGHTTRVYQNEMGETWAWECSCLDEADEFEDEESAQDDADQHTLERP